MNALLTQAVDATASFLHFAVFLAFIDVLFGTAHMPDHWPKRYGTTKFQPPETFVGQLVYPVKRHKENTPYG